MAGVVKNAEFEAKHHRGTHGRFGPGMSKPKLLKRDERELAEAGPSFQLHDIPSAQHAAEYTRGQKRRIRPETVAAFHELAAKLRKRDTSDERIGRLDAAMTPTEHDLMLTRHIPASAFGLREEDLHRLPALLAGRKIIDRAYTPTALHQESAQGGITMHIAVPKGTRALVAGDNEMWLDRDLELAVLDVHPNGRGGYDVRLAALPKAGPKSKSTPDSPFARRLKVAARGAGVRKATPYVKDTQEPDEKVGDHTVGQIDRALDRYVRAGYLGVNNGLRTGHRVNEEKPVIDAIDDGMKHSHLTRSILVSRGIKNPAKVFGDQWNDHDVTGLEWTDKAYTSTSTTMGSGSFFTGRDGVLMRILVPKGTPALTRSTDAEGEVILGRDLSFRVVSDNGVKNGIRHLDVEVVKASAGRPVKKAMPAKKASQAKLTPAQELQRWRADAAKPGRVASKATGPTKREEYTKSWQDRVGQIEAEIARVEADRNDPGAKKSMLDRLRADLKYYVGARDALRANPDSTLDEPAAGITYELAQKVDPARPLAVYGDILHMEGSDDSWTHVNMAELEKIPAELHGIAAAHMAQRDSGGVWVGDKSVAEMDDSQDLAGEQPRGWEPGGTFEQVNGVYRPERRAMLVGRTTNSAHRGAATASHEFGHALDDALGGASRTPEWGALHDRVLATADHRLSPYFKQPGTAGRSEFWAEALSVWVSAYREPDQQRRADAYRVRFGMPLDVARDVHAYFDRIAQQHSGG